jgi:hypothetical protein
MERKISYPLYALALLFSIIVFCIGVYVGNMIDQYNQQAIAKEVENISQKVASAQLLMLLDENGSSFCPVYSSQLDSINADVEAIGYRLSYLEDEKHVYDVPLKKSYFVLEAQSYLLSNRIKERCGDNSTILIYFYSNANCSSCRQQGFDILQARDDTLGKVPLVRIYSFDGDLGSPVANGLKAQFNVTQYPSMVINGALNSGTMSKDSIIAALKSG